MNQWNILVVDDEIMNLEIIQEFLDEPSYHLETAGQGAEAWDKLCSNAKPYDLVILDRMMPVMDGMALLKKIKSDVRFEHLPVIMQTAASTPDQIKEGLEAGCYYYLTKPYKASELSGIVEAALADISKQRSLRSGIAEQPAEKPVAEVVYRFSTLQEVHDLATRLGAICPNPALAAMGLSELMVNAIEHGNLGISYAKKTALKLAGAWEQEINHRIYLPENRNKQATVMFQHVGNELVFTITDQGTGFDWKKYLDFHPDRAFDPNGRGIAMAGKIAFSSIEYQGCGNQVLATIQLD